MDTHQIIPKLTRSEARKADWAKRTPEQRKAHSKKMTTIKYKNMSFEERRAQAMKMVAARKLYAEDRLLTTCTTK